MNISEERIDDESKKKNVTDSKRIRLRLSKMFEILILF